MKFAKCTHVSLTVSEFEWFPNKLILRPLISNMVWYVHIHFMNISRNQIIVKSFLSMDASEPLR